MSGGTDEDEDDKFVAELNRTFKVGEASGLEQAAAHVRKIACDLFAQRKDTEARALREIATDLDDRAKEARPKGRPEPRPVKP